MATRDPSILEPQTAIIPLRQGLDLKTAVQVVDPPALLVAQSTSLFRPGEISKDQGYASLPNTLLSGAGLPSLPVRFVQHPTNQIVVCQDRILERTENPGTFHATSVVTEPASTGSSSFPALSIPAGTIPLLVDAVSFGGFEMFASMNTGNTLVVAVIETATGATVGYSNTALTLVGGIHPRCTVVAGLLCVLWVDGANLRIMKFDTASPAAGLTAPANIVTDVLAATPNMDAVGGVTDLYVAYAQTGPNVRSIRVNRTTLAVLSSVAVAGTANSGIAMCLDTSDNQLIAWCGAPGLSIFGATATTGALRGSSVVSATLGGLPACVSNENPAGSRATVFYQIATGVPVTDNTARHQVNMTGAGGSLATSTLFGFKPYAKPRLASVNTLLVMTYRRADPGVGVAALVTVGHSTANGSTAPAEPLGWYAYGSLSPPAGSTGINAVGNVSPSGSGLRFPGILVASASELFARMFQFRPYDGAEVPLAVSPYFCNSVIATQTGLFDATQPFEPIIQSITASAGGALTPNGVYQYVAYYDYVLPDGTVIQGITSQPFTYTAPPAGNLNATIVATTCFNRSGIVARLRIARTVAGGTVFHVADAANAPASDARTAGNSTFVDNSTDGGIANLPLIYTSGGVLDAYPGPPCRAMCLHQNRIFAIDESNRQIRYTRELVTGEGPAWHPSLAIDVSAVNVDPRALVSATTGLWVLGRDRLTGAGAIALLLGQGAADDGTGATYELQRLADCDVGPDDYRKAVATPLGVLFEDPNQGFHLLADGGGAPVFVGAPIEAHRLELATAVLCMHVLHKKKEVRITTNSQVLVWHYDQNQWSQRAPGNFAIIPQDATIWNGQHTLISTAGAVARQSDTVWQDPGSVFQQTVVRTAWIKTSGFSGLQRIWRIFLLGRWLSAHGLTVNIQYDYNEALAGDTYTFTTADIDAVNASGKYEVRVTPRRQKCEAFRVTISDSDAGSGTRQGAAWTALRLEYGALRGPSRKAALARKS